MTIAGGALRGLVAGAIGAAVIAAAEKAEQRLTRRPSFYVPGRTLAHPLGLSRPEEDPLGATWPCIRARGRPPAR